MRCKALVLAVLATGGVASAQNGPSPAPPPIDTTTTTTTTTDPFATQPQPQPAPEPPPPPPVQQVTEVDSDSDRPDGFSIGLGIGYAMQVMSLETPNIASLRLRLPSGLTFEPTVPLSNPSPSEDDSVSETTAKITDPAVSTLVRLPLVRHGNYELEGLGAARLANQKNNPEGDFNATTSTAFQIGYGVAVTWWISKHWNFSMNIVNPIIDYRTTKQETGIADQSQSTSDTTIGIILDTDVFFMLHLYN